MYARPLHEGTPLTFAVSGMLWKSSLIMFDRETRTLWSHVTGAAVAGPLAGTRLTMLPAVHTSWGLWRTTHPHTAVLAKRGFSLGMPFWGSDHALGLVVGGEAIGFPFASLRQARLAHTQVSDRPLLVVYIEPASTAIAFWREVGGRPLTFQHLTRDGQTWRMEDRETGTRWNAFTGEAVGGPLAGAGLTPVPATQAFLSAWRAIYPRSAVWRPD